MKFGEVPMPEFAGKETERLDDFINNFEATLSQTQFTQFETFLLLKKNLKGEAAKLVAAIPPSNTAYTDAKAVLQEAYAPSTKQKFQILESLYNSKMSFSDHVFDHFSKLQALCDAYDRAKIDSDCIKQFFLWRSFNGPLQEAFTTVTGQYRPNFATIQKHKYEAAERYKDKQKAYSERQKNRVKSFNKENKSSKTSTKESSSTNAANVPSAEKPVWCSLCSNTKFSNDHKMYKCVQFPTAQKKVDRLEKLGGCIKCGYTNHQKATCKFQFKRKCQNCDGSHLSWLCLKSETAHPAASDIDNDNLNLDTETVSDTDEEVGTESDGETANMCGIEVLRACASSNSILPTFEVKVQGKVFKGMRDNGCQKNFISKQLLKETKLKSSGDVTITINGFNSSKDYTAKIATIPMEFGGKTFSIEAVVLPEINVKFMAKGLGEIAKEFRKKGYQLADPSLIKDENMVKKLDLILGVDSTHIFKEKTVVFGTNFGSAYLKTIGGIMPVGNSARMLTNLKHLPIFKETKSNIVKPKLKSPKLGDSCLVSTGLDIAQGNPESEFGQFIGKEKSTELDLQNLIHQTIGYDPEHYNDKYSELDLQVTDYVLDNI